MKIERVFVKLGGSLITDKTRPETAHEDVIARLADELQTALATRPDLSLLLGHGSGSFGHWVASQYGTRSGVKGRSAWLGFARVATSAARLNHIVIDAMLDAGIPVFAVRPSSSARCRDGTLVSLAAGPIQQALEEHLVPLVHGDVALDEVRGGTIVSTEEIMVYLAGKLKPTRILLLGATAGVLMGGRGTGWIEGDVVPVITPRNVETVAASLGAARGRDVTGGMLSKVYQMIKLVKNQPELYVHILTGLQPGLLTRALVEPDLAIGTRIMSN